MQEDWETKEERKRLAEEEATNAALIQDFDDIKARMEADRLLALRLQEEEEESSSLWKREQNSFMIQLQLKEEIQALYEKVKRFDESFTAVGSTKDERKIKEMNEGAKDLEQKRLKKKVAKETPKKEDTTKVPAMVDVTEQGMKKRKGGHIKMLARKRKRPQPDVNSDDEHIKCLKIVTFEEPMGTSGHSTISWRYFISLIGKIYFTCMTWCWSSTQKLHYLKIMMESSTEENKQSDFWSDQQDWKIVTWRLYEACGVYILKLEDGIVIHMLVERRYPLSKDLLQRMLDLGLEVKRESTVALDLIRFIKQQIDEN
ncbi:hypothetical protein Tco_1294004 [Tanacetum coccineum]